MFLEFAIILIMLVAYYIQSILKFSFAMYIGLVFVLIVMVFQKL